MEKTANNGSYNMVLDIKDVKFIDSTGFRYLMKWFVKQQAQGHNMKLANVSTDVAELIKLLNLEEYFLYSAN